MTSPGCLLLSSALPLTLRSSFFLYDGTYNYTELMGQSRTQLLRKLPNHTCEVVLVMRGVMFTGPRGMLFFLRLLTHHHNISEFVFARQSPGKSSMFTHKHRRSICLPCISFLSFLRAAQICCLLHLVLPDILFPGHIRPSL